MKVWTHGTIVWERVIASYSSAVRAATLVYDTDGNLLWTARFEGAGLDEANCVAFGSVGGVYVSGQLCAKAI